MKALEKKEANNVTHQKCEVGNTGFDTLIAQLKACTKAKDLQKGRNLHSFILINGLLEKSIVIGNTLVNMYAKCGALSKAHEIFDDLPVKDVVSWNALIAGYAHHGHSEEALNCFELMQLRCFSPNSVTILSILKACSSIGELTKGREIHAKIAKETLLVKEMAICTALVDMYGKYGELAKAQAVFGDLPMQDVVSWNALIAGYSQHGYGEEALYWFEQMKHEGFAPDAVTFSCILKACASIVSIDKGQEVHANIVGDRLLGKNTIVGTALVDMYAKCGLVEKAQEVFDELPNWNIISWNALIAGYTQHGRSTEALKCLERMQHGGLSPDPITYVCILKACADVQDINKGQDLHFEIVKYGLLSKDTILGNALVDMYAKCGFLAKAQDVFHKLPMRNVVSWNVLITGYVQHGDAEEALSYFEKMQVENTSPNDVTFLSILKACGLLRALEKGQEIHAQIKKGGFLRENNGVGAALVDMYVKCGLLERAQAVFDELPHWDVVSWTSLIAGYAEHGHCDEALKCFEWLELKGLFLDLVTFVCMLKVCASIRLASKGQELHTKIVQEGVLDKDTVVGTALVDMYAICGMLLDAQKVFEKLPIRDIAAWNALIAGYVQYGFSEEAMNCFENMRQLAYSPDVTTFACMLKACGSTGNVEKGEEIHVEISKQGSLGKDTIVGTALVDMYAKCGMLAKAQQVFDELSIRNVISWNALIAGYALQECNEEALNCFMSMQLEGLFPDEVTFLPSLKACGSIVAPMKGQKMHLEIVKVGLLEKNNVLGNVLIDMYAKCGLVAEAQESFDALQVKDVVSWNALISGYAQLGNDEVAFCTFTKMVGEGKEPNLATFSILLNTCSHTGQLNQAYMYFDSMNSSYSCFPTLDHYTCMVDLYCRAGQVEQTMAVIIDMPFHADLSIWNTLLGACQKWGNVQLGILAFEHVIQLDKKDVVAYVSLSNIYAASGEQGDSEKIKGILGKEPRSC